MDSSKYFIISLTLSLVILAIGTTGYMFIEGWTLLDAMYMTVITLTTVGYGEVHEVSKIGRLFTILLIFAGAGFFLYLAGTIVQIMVEGRIRLVLGRVPTFSSLKKS